MITGSVEPFSDRQNDGTDPNNDSIKPISEEPELSSSHERADTRATYRIKKLLIADVFPVFMLFIIPAFAHAGFFTGIIGFFSSQEEAARAPLADSVQSVPLLRAAVHADPNPSKGGGDIIVTEDGALEAAGAGFSEDAANQSSGEVSVYVVREGDSLSQIAQMYGVTTNTILWANDIEKASSIQPGDSLVILPISGVRHIVKKGDTLKSIASKYKGNVEDIIAYNQLADASDIAIGETIVIPGGQVQAAVGTVRAAVSGGVSVASGFFAHPVPGAVRTQGIHGYNGVDLGGPAGTPVRAAAGGEVVISKASGWNGGYGNYIVVKHSNGTQTLYAHLSSNKVATGETVSQGQVIGAIGNTGRSTGNHLHFEVRGAKNPF